MLETTVRNQQKIQYSCAIMGSGTFDSSTLCPPLSLYLRKIPFKKKVCSGVAPSLKLHLSVIIQYISIPKGIIANTSNTQHRLTQ